MRNVLVVSPTGALINGAERAGLSLMTSLADRGFQILNAFPLHYKQYEPDRFLSYDHSLSNGGIVELPIDFGWWLPGDEAFGRRELTAVAELMRFIEADGIDVVVTNTSNFPWGAMAAALTGRRHVWLLHEFPSGVFSWLGDKYDFIGEYSSTVFCASPSLQEVVLSRIQQAGHDVPVHTFRPHSDVSGTRLTEPQPARIVVVGGVNRRKNQIEAVRTLPLLRSRGLSPTLLFIGGVEDDDYFAEISCLANDLGVSSQVSFMMHHDDPWSLVSPMDVVLQCSETEVFSLVACEAALLGLRLVLSRNHSSIDIAALLGDIPLYDLGDIDTLARVLAEMLTDQAATVAAALKLRDVAVQVLSIDSCYASILADLSQTPAESNHSALKHIGPYFSSFVSDTSAEIANLSRRVKEMDSRVEALNANDAELRSELSRVYASRTWRLGRLLTAPLRSIRRLRRGAQQSGQRRSSR